MEPVSFSDETWEEVRNLRKLLEGGGIFRNPREREELTNRAKEAVADKVLTVLINTDAARDRRSLQHED